VLLAAGCGSSAKKNVAGLPLWQRVLLGNELVGYDPPPQPPPLLRLGQFINQAKPAFIQITKAGAQQELQGDGFKTATIESFPGNSPTSPIIASSVLLVGSNQQAEKVVKWSIADSLRPCREACTATWKSVKISGIPGAEGAYRHNLTPGVRPFESYNLAFADGPFVYDLFVLSPKPGTFNRNDLLKAVKAQYNRVKGAPLPRNLVRRA
jgi:hypothetical protein